MTQINFEALYPYPAIRGRRIMRWEEKKIGDVQLDRETAQCLGYENIGVLVGNCGSLDRVIQKLEGLVNCSYPGKWLVLFSTKVAASQMYRHLNQGRRLTEGSRFWSQGNCIFSTPEGLKECQNSISLKSEVSAMILVDLPGIMHCARGNSWGRYRGNDRPQLIADFRADLSEDGWIPPFYLLTDKPVKSINSQQMLSAYCLENWWFVDGDYLRIGIPPQIGGLYSEKETIDIKSKPKG